MSCACISRVNLHLKLNWIDFLLFWFACFELFFFSSVIFPVSDYNENLFGSAMSASPELVHIVEVKSSLVWTTGALGSTPTKNNNNNSSNTLPRCHNSIRKQSTRRRLNLLNTRPINAAPPQTPATTQLPRRTLNHGVTRRRDDASPMRTMRNSAVVDLYWTSSPVTSHQVCSERDATKRLSRSADMLLDGVDWCDIVIENDLGPAPLACDEELEKTLLAPDTPSLHDVSSDNDVTPIWDITQIDSATSDGETNDDVSDDDHGAYELCDLKYAITDDDDDEEDHGIASDTEQSVTSSEQSHSASSSSGVMSASTVSSSSSASNSFFSRSLLASTTRTLRSKVRTMTSSFRVATNPALRHLRFKSWRRRTRTKGVSESQSNNSFASPHRLEQQMSLLGDACNSDSQVNDVTAQMTLSCEVCSECQKLRAGDARSVRDAGVTTSSQSSSASHSRPLCNFKSSHPRSSSTAMTSSSHDRDRYTTLPK